MTATSDISLADKVIFVTGASRGIGAAIAHACAEAGAAVALASRKRPDLEAVAGSIRDGGGRAVAIPCHVGDPDQVEEALSRAVEELGRIDGVVNNAATNPYFGPMIDIDRAAFDKTFEVNVKGYFECARQFVRHVRARGGGGSIVNMASIAGLRPQPLQGVYGMTKASVVAMTRQLALELGGSGIRVNAIAPGLIETRFSSAIVGNDKMLQHAVGRTPLGRHGQPREIAGGAVYLLSDAASFVTGHTLTIDGGIEVG